MVLALSAKRFSMSAQIRHKIQELCEEISDHQFKYYVLDAPTITDAEIEALALAHPTIAAELNGATPKKVIARAPKIVNIVL